LAAAPIITLPVIRLIRQTLLGGETGQVHEAEVLLGGLVHAIGPAGSAIDPEEILYDFHDGVRARLLDILPGADARRVLWAISQYIEDRLGLDPGTVRTLVADPLGEATGWKTTEAPIARIFLDVLGRLGGDYTRLALRLRPDHEKPTPSGYAPRSFQGLEPKRVDERATQQPLCLVHFSDLHFDASRPWNEEAPIYQLPGAVRSLLDRIALHPDLIVITGDIAVQGRAEEFEQASQWIEERLLAALEPFERRNVIVVPGNHDMDQKAAHQRNVPGSRDAERISELPDSLDWNELARSLRFALQGFRDFTRSYCPYPDYLDGGIVVEVGGLRVGLARLCSSWPGVVGPRGAEDFPLLGRDQLNSVFTSIRDADLTIALMHHPPERLDPREYSLFRDHMRASECRLVLHGHVHSSKSLRVRRQEEWEFLSLGTLGFAHGKQPSGMFQVVTLDQNGTRADVRALVWQPSTRAWIIDTEAWAAGGEGVATFKFAPRMGHPAEALDEKLPFPMKHSHSFLHIVSAIQNGILVPVLGPSVNPADYVDLAAHLVKLTEREEFPNDPNRMQEQNFVRAHLDDEDMLSVAKSNCRRLSWLYEIQTSIENLYYNIADCIIESSKGDNTIHLVLASLLKNRQAIGSRGRKPDLPFPIIITTNFDAGLERVFDRERIPYDLVWLVAAGDNRGRWLHLGYKAEERVILDEKPGTEAIRKRAFSIGNGTAFDLDPDPRVIIIKMFGSINDPDCRRVFSKMLPGDDYFLITQDQMESFSSNRVHNLANELVRKIWSMKLLFLGFSPNDPDLRAIVDRLYGKEKLPNQCWIIHRCRPGKLEQVIWESRGRVQLLRVDESLEQTMIDFERGVRDVSRTV